MKKRIQSIILVMVMSIALITSNISIVFAEQIPNEMIDAVQITNPDEVISVIIELEKKPVLDCSQAQLLGAEAYLSTDAAVKAREKLLNRQMAVQKAILEKINADALFSSHYTNTINGFSVIVRRGDIPKIKAMQEVKSIYADESYKAPESKMEPKLASSTAMIGATNIWGLENYKGEGTVVAVIDTGVDVNHEYMVIADGTTVKLTKESIATIIANSELNAEDLTALMSADDVYYNRKFPFCFDYADNDADAHADTDSHGVQVAGVIAANGTVAQATRDNLHTTIEFNGVAPEAQIIGMKVFPSNGGEASTSVIIKAVEDAVSLGADVINVSLGSPAGFTFLEGLDLRSYELEYSFAIARNTGVIITAPAGNEGRSGKLSYIYQLSNGGYSFPSTSYTDNGTINSPASKYHATAVASVNNAKKVLPYIRHADGRKISYTDFVDNDQRFVTAFSGQTLQYVNCGRGETADFEGKDLSGKLALIERGILSFSEKAANAQSAGAMGAIIYNNAANGDDIENAPEIEPDLPAAILIGRTDGLHLLNASSTNMSVSIDSSFTEGVFDNLNNGRMSEFSAWGSTPDLKLKPEITAPGEYIYTTTTGNGYASVSGTSIASAHIAGAAALMQQYMKNIEFSGYIAENKGDLVEALLMSTADILCDEYTGQYSPRKQGAGLADLDAAMNSDVYLLNAWTGKAKIELGDFEQDTFNIEFDAYNLSGEARSYQLVGSVYTDDAVRLGSYGYFTIPYSSNLTYSKMFADGHTINPAYAGTPSGTPGSAVVTVPAGGSVHIRVSVQLDEDEMNYYNGLFDNGFFIEGFIELQAIDVDQPDLSIPYMGYYGDWTEAPIIDGSRYFENYLDDSGSRNYFYGNSYPYCYERDENGQPTGRFYALGGDEEGETYKYPQIAFSPNGDNKKEEMGYKANFLRNAKFLQVYILNSGAELVKVLMDEVYRSKTLAKKVNGEDSLNSELLPVWDGKDGEGRPAADGQYYYVISAMPDYDGATAQNTIVPVKIDTIKPALQNVTLNAETMILTGRATDATYISYVKVIGSGSDGNIVRNLEDPMNLYDFSFDLSSFTGRYITLAAGDIAGNEQTQIIENPNTFTVTFNLNGGNISGYNSNIVSQVIKNQCAVRPADPQKSGFTFNGWYKQGESAPYDFTTSITENTELVAHFILVNAETPTIVTDISPTEIVYTEGDTAEALTVSASVYDGGTLSYQWYSNISNSVIGGTAVGTNSAAYTPDTSEAGTLYYYVVITNTIPDNGDDGNKTATATSAVARITVNPALIPLYAISLDTTGTYAFAAATEGYGAQAEKTVTITNIGNQDTGEISLGLSGANRDVFILSPLSIPNIATSSNATFAVVPDTGLEAGTYTATVSVTSAVYSQIDESFDVNFTVNAFTPVKQNQTITWNQSNFTATEGDSPITLNASADSGLTVSYSSDNASVATVSGNTLTIVGAGTAAITASQAGDTNYNAAASVTRTITVNAPQPNLSTDATLSNLTVSNGSLTPAFDPATSAYAVNVANSVSSITLTATKNDTNAAVSGDGVKSLSVGTNTFNIIVTAEDGTTTNTYIITVTRANASSNDNDDDEEESSSGSSSTMPDNTTTQFGNTKIMPNPGQAPVFNTDGSQTLPKGGTITITAATESGTGEAPIITFNAPPGTTIGKDGSVRIPDNCSTAITITAANPDDPNVKSTVTVTVPGGSYVSKDGIITTGSGSAQLTLPDNSASISLPQGTTVTPDGIITIGSGSAMLTLPGNNASISLPQGTTVDTNGTVTIPSGIGASVSLPGSCTLSIAANSVIILDEAMPLGYYVMFDNPFADVNENNWFYKNMEFVNSSGLFLGTSNTTFGPNTPMTRDMFVTVLYRLAGSPGTADLPQKFTDVPADAYYAEAVKWAAANGITSGTEPDKFSPDDSITREQAATFFYNYAKAIGAIPDKQGDLSDFADVDKVSAWALDAMRYCVDAGIIVGKPGNLLDPQAEASRAEVAAMFHRFVLLLAGQNP